MRHSRARIFCVVAFVVVWQFIVFVLSSAGIFGDIYRLLGIPWNAEGIVNVVGTTVGLLLLELPAVVVVILLLRQSSRKF